MWIKNTVNFFVRNRRYCSEIVLKEGFWVPVQKETHTNQIWENDDYRLCRFIDREKLVNENFAVNLISEIPPKKISSRVVYCNGGGGALGHPKVFINLDKPGTHTCGYCGLSFEKES